MSLTLEDIEFIKTHLVEWLAEISLGKPPMVYEIELRERLVRVEEELKHQRELIQQNLVQMDKRFEQVDKRLDQIDQRFGQEEKQFERVDAQFLQRIKRIDHFMIWSLATIVSVGGLVVALIKYF